LPLNPIQKSNILKGQIGYTLGAQKHRPQIYAIWLRSECNLNDIKDGDIVIRDCTNAFILADRDLEKIREDLLNETK
jgi:hypothetical protein